MSAISDNISNVDTIGYKQSQVNFEDLVTNSGSTGEYTAGGVSSTNQQMVSQQGSIQQTSSPTDLAISGSGMFVTTQSPTPITGSSTVLYTRAGSFTPDAQGFLRNDAGLYLQAYPASIQGVVQDQSSSLLALQPVNVANIGGTVSASTSADLTANLDASQAVSTQAQDTAAVVAGTATAAQTAAAYNPSTNSMAAYDANNNTGVEPNYQIQVPISDSQGGEHTVQIDMLKSTTANTWYCEIQAVPTSDVPASGTAPAGQIAYGTVTFDTSGNLASVSLTNSATGAAITGGNSPQVSIPWGASLGVASPQAMTLSLGSNLSGAGLTQFNSPSATQPAITDGTPFGSLLSVSVGSTGQITASFSNSTERVIGQIALATFPNVNGLNAVSGDAYTASSTSGACAINTAGSGGTGTIDSSALESSTVDLSAQFAAMIVTQRAYTASSKIITTADQMTQDLLQIIR
jgi:flagellar hook protein FlgE